MDIFTIVIYPAGTRYTTDPAITKNTYKKFENVTYRYDRTGIYTLVCHTTCGTY